MLFTIPQDALQSVRVYRPSSIFTTLFDSGQAGERAPRRRLNCRHLSHHLGHRANEGLLARVVKCQRTYLLSGANRKQTWLWAYQKQANSLQQNEQRMA